MNHQMTGRNDANDLGISLTGNSSADILDLFSLVRVAPHRHGLQILRFPSDLPMDHQRSHSVGCRGFQSTLRKRSSKSSRSRKACHRTGFRRLSGRLPSQKDPRHRPLDVKQSHECHLEVLAQIPHLDDSHRFPVRVGNGDSHQAVILIVTRLRSSGQQLGPQRKDRNSSCLEYHLYHLLPWVARIHQ